VNCSTSPGLSTIDILISVKTAVHTSDAPHPLGASLRTAGSQPLRPRSTRRHNGGVPFTCEVCGRRGIFPDLIPAVDGVLRCPHCADERPFVRPPLLIVTGTVGIGKSTLCARLAGTITGALLLDADILAVDLVSVVPPKQDYPAFWRSMMRLAHELAQNNVVVVYFSTMLPEQVLANSGVLGYFRSVHFLCLSCPPDVLHARLAGRDGSAAANARIDVWSDFNNVLVAAASAIPTATVVDAGRTTDQVEHDVRHWINTQLRQHPVLRKDSTPSSAEANWKDGN
jgi:broad-specificity NMP kinase